MNNEEYMECVDAIYESMEGISWEDETLFNTYYFLLGLQRLLHEYGELDEELKLHIMADRNYFVKSKIEHHTGKKLDNKEFRGYYVECLIEDWLESAHQTLFP